MDDRMSIPPPLEDDLRSVPAPQVLLMQLEVEVYGGGSAVDVDGASCLLLYNAKMSSIASSFFLAGGTD